MGVRIWLVLSGLAMVACAPLYSIEPLTQQAEELEQEETGTTTSQALLYGNRLKHKKPQRKSYNVKLRKVDRDSVLGNIPPHLRVPVDRAASFKPLLTSVERELPASALDNMFFPQLTAPIQGIPFPSESETAETHVDLLAAPPPIGVTREFVVISEICALLGEATYMYNPTTTTQSLSPTHGAHLVEQEITDSIAQAKKVMLEFISARVKLIDFDVQTVAIENKIMMYAVKFKHPFSSLDTGALVFRGTTEAENWLFNFRAAFVNLETGVSKGFDEAYSNVQSAVWSSIHQMTLGKGVEGLPGGLIVIGHSLGAAMAAICAADILTSKTIQFPQQWLNVSNNSHLNQIDFVCFNFFERWLVHFIHPMHFLPIVAGDYFWPTSHVHFQSGQQDDPSNQYCTLCNIR
jgi:hypothetical protein